MQESDERLWWAERLNRLSQMDDISFARIASDKGETGHEDRMTVAVAASGFGLKGMPDEAVVRSLVMKLARMGMERRSRLFGDMERRFRFHVVSREL